MGSIAPPEQGARGDRADLVGDGGGLLGGDAPVSGDASVAPRRGLSRA